MNKKIDELLEQKRNSNLSNEEKEELSLIESMLVDKTWYNKVDPNTAASILLFLGIPMEELEDYYISLISSNDDITDKYELIDENGRLKWFI